METSFPRDRVDERLDHTLRRALDAAGGGADGVEAVLRASEASHLRLAESAVVQAADVVEGKVIVRAVVAGREARAITTDLTDDGLAACACLAVSRARSAPASAEPLVLAPPVEVPAAPSWALDLDTASLDAETKSRWLRPAFRAHEKDGLALAGRFHTGLMTVAVRSTAGVAAYHQGSFADLSLSALERPAGHRASSFRARVDARIDEGAVDEMQATVRDECHRAHDPVVLAPGDWDVVLAPAATAELLEWLATIAFSSETLDDGTSFVAGNEGRQVTGAAVTLVDDASMPHRRGVPLPFDVEGQPKRRVTLVDRGVARDFVHDTRTARRHGCSGTGHAQLDELFPRPGSRANHLHLEPGDATPEDLVRRVSRGLLITRFHYVNAMIEPRRAVMTGLLRDGAFLIEEGRLTRAVQSLRFTDSILEAFARIPGSGAISSDLEPHNAWFNGWSCSVAPWLLVPALRFTSGR